MSHISSLEVWWCNKKKHIPILFGGLRAARHIHIGIHGMPKSNSHASGIDLDVIKEKWAVALKSQNHNNKIISVIWSLWNLVTLSVKK